jgi:hypothetical protein
METLVTIILMALAATIFWQAWAQFVRIEAMLDSSSFGLHDDLVRIELAKRILGASLALPNGNPNALRGERRVVSGMTGAPPNDLGIATYRLALNFDKELGRTALSVSSVPEDGAPPATLLSWQGNTGQFLFLGHDAMGQLTWLDEWPAALPHGRTALTALPLAIALETGIEHSPVIVAALLLGPRTLPDRNLLGGF